MQKFPLNKWNSKYFSASLAAARVAAALIYLNNCDRLPGTFIGYRLHSPVLSFCIILWLSRQRWGGRGRESGSIAGHVQPGSRNACAAQFFSHRQRIFHLSNRDRNRKENLSWARQSVNEPDKSASNAALPAFFVRFHNRPQCVCAIFHICRL